MRRALLLLGIMSIIVYVGAFIALSQKGHTPVPPSTASSSIQSMSSSLSLTSPAFSEGGRIPLRFTCDAEGVHPEFHIDGVPEGTESFVLLMDDPDIPDTVKQARGIQTFDHWVVYNIPKETQVIGEGVVIGNEGLNSRGTIGYVGPCPPDREHRYFFRLYALSGKLNFIQTPKLYDVEEAAKGMTLASTTLMGRYDRVRPY